MTDTATTTPAAPHPADDPRPIVRRTTDPETGQPAWLVADVQLDRVDLVQAQPDGQIMDEINMHSWRTPHRAREYARRLLAAADAAEKVSTREGE